MLAKFFGIFLFYARYLLFVTARKSWPSAERNKLWLPLGLKPRNMNITAANALPLFIVLLFSVSAMDAQMSVPYIYIWCVYPSSLDLHLWDALWSTRLSVDYVTRLCCGSICLSTLRTATTAVGGAEAGLTANVHIAQIAAGQVAGAGAGSNSTSRRRA